MTLRRQAAQSKDTEESQAELGHSIGGEVGVNGQADLPPVRRSRATAGNDRYLQAGVRCGYCMSRRWTILDYFIT